MSENSNQLVVSDSALSDMQKMRGLLKEFVSSQMNEADYDVDPSNPNYGVGDYGIIPGTKKKSLHKPGGEKLQQLFNLGTRIKSVDKEVDRHENFAMFTYKCEVYSKKDPDVIIAECEGSCNSQEKKYKERTVWKDAKRGKARERTTEETPIFDIINTLMKMAQKRAYLGAIIIATGASDFFTTDFDTEPLEPVENEKPSEKTKKARTPAKGEKVPKCCGREMMVSKWPDKETGTYPYYCVKCKAKVQRAA